MIREDKNCYTCDNKKCNITHSCIRQDVTKHHEVFDNEWHYVKDELPPENVPLNIITFDKNKKKRLWEGEYKGGNGQWWTGYFNHYIDVPYAWKEIVLPKEELKC